MPSGRKHELNDLDDPNFNPLDPACVSDPACWLPVSTGAEIQKGFVERTRMLKHAPTFHDEAGKVGVLYVDELEDQEPSPNKADTD